jgi:hypothetical protein
MLYGNTKPFGQLYFGVQVSTETVQHKLATKVK